MMLANMPAALLANGAARRIRCVWFAAWLRRFLPHWVWLRYSARVPGWGFSRGLR